MTGGFVPRRIQWPRFVELLTTEFSVPDGDFSALEIRDGGGGTGFHYFYDTKSNRLITDFIIKDGPRVATLCQVTLIKKEDTFSPRLKFWKKDKTKTGVANVQEEIVLDEAPTRMVKAVVDTGDAYQNFWKLIHFLQSFAEVAVPDDNFRVVTNGVAELARIFEGEEKETILAAIRATLGSSLTEADLRLMGNRKAQLEVFEQMLADEDFFEEERQRLGARGAEAVWQQFFEANPWIFGYGLNLVACEPLSDLGKLERITTGANIFTGAGKRIDAIMRSKGYVSSLVFCEIKTHRTPLLESKAYRPPDVYQVSEEVSGGLSQVQKTVSKALGMISGQLHDLYGDDGAPTGVQFSTIKPRQALVIGHLDEFSQHGRINPEKLASFELYRTAVKDVEIITFDELYERASFIVRDS